MRFELVMIVMAAFLLAGCKKDETSSGGPSGPPDTWLRIVKLDSTGEYMEDVVETNEGEFIMAGSQDQQSFLMRLNSQGDTLWTRNYAVSGSHLFHALITLPDGGVLAAGQDFFSSNALLVRTNAAGGVVWLRETYAFRAWGIAAVSDGNFVIAGIGRLMKISANGDSIWSKESPADLLGVIALGDGGTIAVGYRYVDFVNYTAYIMRSNAQGDSLWTREFTLTDRRLYVWDIARTGDGDYVAVGQYDDLTPTGGAWAAKFSESGAVRWSNTYEGEKVYRHVATGTDGLAVTVGTQNPGNADADILLVKLDNSGSVVWSRSFLTVLDETGNAITATSDGGFVIAGTTGGTSGSDIIVIKVDENGEI